MRILLKATFILLLTFAGFSNQAQAQINVGGGLSYGSDVEALGIFLRGEYGINETWRGAGSFNIFFLEDIPGIDVGWNALSLDAHYIFSDDESLQFYGLGGLNIAFVKVGINLGAFGSVSETATEVGLNLGAGGRLKVSDQFAAFLEVKFVLGDASQLVPFLGAVYTISE